MVGDSRLKGFPKYSLNMVRSLAARYRDYRQQRDERELRAGDIFYAQQAVFAPHLENGISPMAT